MANPVLRPRIPSPLQPKPKPTKKASKKRASKKGRPSVARARKPTSLKQQVDATIASIHEELRTSSARYWDIGRALISLRQPEIWRLYAETTYRGFLEEHVMPFSTARRMITVAETYSQPIAEAIGHERGYQLARLARIDRKIKKSAEQLWKTNAKLSKRRVRDMSAADIERLVRGAVLRSNKSRRPKPAEEEKQAYDRMKTAFQKAFKDLEADFDLDLRKRKIRIELNLDDLLT